jgi:2,4-dienoyl-CoA reductase-like NADH-dependent reductase (Old Yellow Enzyme family)
VDLINVALEELIRARCEVPGYSTLDELAARIRAEVNSAIFHGIGRRKAGGLALERSHPRSAVQHYRLRYATIPFWRRVGAAVHRHRCAYVAQLSHSGRQQDLGGLENEGIVPLSSSNRRDGIHGLPGRAMTKDEIKWMVGLFAAAARRAQEAGLDGIELHGSSGYLITTS